MTKMDNSCGLAFFYFNKVVEMLVNFENFFYFWLSINQERLCGRTSFISHVDNEPELLYL